MVTAEKPLFHLTAEDVMSRELITIPRQMSLKEAARILRRANVTGAPVVDEQGRCVGVLSASDFLHWTEDGCPDNLIGTPPACSYQVRGRLPNGEEAVVCTLSEGSCPLQIMRPITGGRHVALCLQPRTIVNDWQQLEESVPKATVRHYMTTDIVTAEVGMPLSELAGMMIDAHIHRILVLDEWKRPVGVVASSDILAAVFRDWQRTSLSAH